jgi:hypothetical protein
MTKITEQRKTNLLHYRVKTYQDPQVRSELGHWVVKPDSEFSRPIETPGGRIWLCQLPDGRNIHLPTTFTSAQRVITIIEQQKGLLIAEVRISSRPLHPRGKMECFVIKREKEILIEGEPLLDPAQQAASGRQSAPAPDPTPRWLQQQNARQTVAWWEKKSRILPDPHEKTVQADGNVYLCARKKIAVYLLAARECAGLPARLSYFQEGLSRLVRLEIGGPDRTYWLIREFFLVEDDVRLTKPSQRSLEDKLGNFLSSAAITNQSRKAQQ